MRRRAGLSLIERALIEKQWHATAVEANVQALMSDDSDRMVNAAGRILFVVLGACIAEEASESEPAVLAVTAAVDAVHEQAGEPVVTPERRARIVAGLDVCGFLVSVLDRRNVVASACELELKLRAGHVNTSDFEALVARFAKTNTTTENRAQ